MAGLFGGSKSVPRITEEPDNTDALKKREQKRRTVFARALSLDRAKGAGLLRGGTSNTGLKLD